MAHCSARRGRAEGDSVTVQATVTAWLHEHLSIDSATEVRLLCDSPIPDDMGINMEGYIPDGDWAWIAEKEGRINGFLAAAPCHGIVMVLRFVVRAHAPFDTLPLLLRRFVRDCRNRGYIGFFAPLNPDRPHEKKLMQMMMKLGAARIDECQCTMAVNFDKVLRY